MSTLRAKESFTAYVGNGSAGQALHIAAGELYDSGHVVVAGREKLFESVEDHVADPGRKKTSVSRGDEKKPSHVLMERASAEPGERRSVDTKTGVQDKPKAAPAAARRSPVKVDDSDLPKGKKDGEV